MKWARRLNFEVSQSQYCFVFSGFFVYLFPFKVLNIGKKKCKMKFLYVLSRLEMLFHVCSMFLADEGASEDLFVFRFFFFFNDLLES